MIEVNLIAPKPHHETPEGAITLIIAPKDVRRAWVRLIVYPWFSSPPWYSLAKRQPVEWSREN